MTLNAFINEVLSAVKAHISWVQDLARESDAKVIAVMGPGLVFRGQCIHTYWFVSPFIGK